MKNLPFLLAFVVLLLCHTSLSAQFVYTSPSGNIYRLNAGVVQGTCSNPQFKVFNHAQLTDLSADELQQAFASIPVQHYFKVKAGMSFNFSIDYEDNAIPVSGNDRTVFVDESSSGYGYNGSPNTFEHTWQLISYYSDPFNGTIFINPYNFKFDQAVTKGWIAFQLTESWVDPNFNIIHHDYLNFYLPFVVEGPIQVAGLPANEVPILGITTQPQLPYLILHAPPGDGSSSAFQESKTTCRESSTFAQEENSGSANLGIKLGIAGSLGLIATINYEFSVTINAGVSGGAMNIVQSSNQTCVQVGEGFQTTELTGPDGGGDVFIGYGTDLFYGVFRNVILDPNTCEARIDTGLVYVPTGDVRKFVYTKSAILSDIALQQSYVDNPSLTTRARNNAQNQVDVWNQVLALNNANINDPNAAPLGNISFSSGTSSSQESSITITDTKSISYEQYIETTVGLEVVLEIGGSGITGGFEYRNAKRYGQTQNQSQENSKVLRYTLADDDSGDVFNLDIVRDPMFGTPIFRPAAGTKSSCPYQGGYQRDQPKLKHEGVTADHITLLGNPVGASATFKLDLCNESNEARTYNLKLNAQSNLNGAVVSAAGVPLNGNDLGQSFTIPANTCVQDLVVEVKQLSTNSPLAYPNLELFLYSACEEEIQSSVFASVYFGNATGVEDVQEPVSRLAVSPNPASDVAYLDFDMNEMAPVRLELWDMQGLPVKTELLGTLATGQHRQAMELSDLPNGIYLLALQSNGSRMYRKVVVQR